MNYTTIRQKGKSILLWLYKNIKNKFTSIFKKITDRFPIIKSYPLLKYSLIPIVLALFFSVRYLVKTIIDELTASTSGFLGETSGYNISERAIVLSIAAIFIISRLLIKLRTQKNDRNKKSEKAEVAI